MKTKNPLRTRLLSLVLVVAMLFTAMPSAVFATEPADSGYTESTEQPTEQLEDKPG